MHLCHPPYILQRVKSCSVSKSVYHIKRTGIELGMCIAKRRMFSKPIRSWIHNGSDALIWGQTLPYSVVLQRVKTAVCQRHENRILFTYSIEQSHSWETKPFLASQEIQRISWSLRVHYSVCKIPPPVPILIQINPVHGPQPTSWRSLSILLSHLRLGF
jgi:hypothetical protein